MSTNQVRMNNDRLNARGAAELLGTHVETIRRLARENQIPGRKIGGTWHFSKHELIGVDITELNKQHGNVQRLHDEITKNMSEGVYLVRADDGVIVFANPRFEQMFGYAPGELIGLHVSVVNAPSDKSPEETASEIMRDLLRDGVWRGQVNNIMKDGTSFWCDASVSMFDHHEYGKVMVAIHTNITEYKKAETVLRLHKDIVENMAEGVYMIRASDGIIVYANSHLEKMFGYEPDEMVGLHVNIVNASSDKSPEETAKEIINTLRETGVWSGEVNNIKKDGSSTFWCHANVTTFDHPQYGMVWLSVHEDITERKRAQKDLQESNARLQSALGEIKRTHRQVIEYERLAALGQMAGGIAHDFNNLLMPILGYSDYLLENPESWNDKEEVYDILKTIRGSSMEARNTIQRLKEFYRPKLDVDHDHLDTKELIEDAIALTRPRWKEEMHIKDIHIKIGSDLAENIFVNGNAGQLKEMLVNVIFNALDALHSSGTINIRTQSHESNQMAVIEISDDGTGMTEEVRRRCMEPFFTTRFEHGAGLGLSMTQGIIRQHGGNLTIDSIPAKGTRVTIYLPRSEPPATSVQSKTPAPTKVSITKSLRILAIDDEEVIRSFVKSLLSLDGHIVETAVDGRAGIQKFRKKGFDLVITDRAMPGMSGDQVAKAIKQMDETVPVIMLTGYTHVTGADQSDKTSITDIVDLVLGKPVSRKELQAAIAQVIMNSKVYAEAELSESEIKFKWVIPDKLARSAGPKLESPETTCENVDAWISVLKKQGIKTVITVLEKEELSIFYGSLPGGFIGYCGQRGLIVYHVDVPDYKSPPLSNKDTQQVWEFYQDAQKPVLVHCRRGIARAGHATYHIKRELSKT